MSIATTKPACRYVKNTGYFLPSHLPTCVDNTCPGCEPCTHDNQGNPVRHCEARDSCTSHLQPEETKTCARCVGRTRRDLQQIEELTAHAYLEAIAAGVDSEAAALTGPAVDQVQWDRRKTKIRLALLRLPADKLPDPALLERYRDDRHHPYAVLARWEHTYRHAYGQPTTLRSTLSSARKYLDGMLDTIAQDPNEDFPQFASEIARCRAHLEATIADSRKPERGAPCPLCPEDLTADPPIRKPRLIRRYGHWCAREDCRREHDATGASDHWICPNNDDHRWTEAEYRLRIGQDHLDHAPALTATQIEERYGIKAGTIRSWASETKRLVHKRGRDASGRQLYDVNDARRQAGQIKPEGGRIGA